MTGPLNAQPSPDSAPSGSVPPRPVWVATIWDGPDGKTKDLVPATATHEVGELVLCSWYEPRADTRHFWMLREHVRDREVKHTRHTTSHPAAAPSPPTQIGS